MNIFWPQHSAGTQSTGTSCADTSSSRSVLKNVCLVPFPTKKKYFTFIFFVILDISKHWMVWYCSGNSACPCLKSTLSRTFRGKNSKHLKMFSIFSIFSIYWGSSLYNHPFHTKNTSFFVSSNHITWNQSKFQELQVNSRCLRLTKRKGFLLAHIPNCLLAGRWPQNAAIFNSPSVIPGENFTSLTILLNVHKSSQVYS